MNWNRRDVMRAAAGLSLVELEMLERNPALVPEARRELERRRALLGRLPAGRMGARGEASTGEGGETPPGEAP